MFWLLARVLPGIIGSIASSTIQLRCFVILVMLPIGFYVVKKMAKATHFGCIRVNLYIFAFIEGMGAFEILDYIVQDLRLRSGQYSTDMYGIPYSNFTLYYGGFLLFEIIYVIFCIYLAKKTKSQISEEPSKAPINPSIEEMTQTKRSSTIEAVLRKDGDFYIKLRSGNFYLYRNFPRKVYLQMMNAPSMGDYYRKNIEGKYQCVQLASDNNSELHAATSSDTNIRERVEEVQNRIAKLENNLKEHDQSYTKSRLILDQAYSDEELIKMVTAGEFPPDRIKEYVDNRDNLKSFIDNAPWIRESIVKMIADSKAELNQLLSQN